MSKTDKHTDVVHDEREATDSEKKRKRAEASSVSSTLDTSTGTCTTKSTEKQKKKKKKKKGKHESDEDIDSIVREIETQSLNKINNQLREINQKLTNVITKDDGNLRDIIKETFTQMKEELLCSVYKRIDILEGKLFDKETENENLKKEVTKLEKEIENHNVENDKLKEEIQEIGKKTEGRMNDLEQYSRMSNIRIDGIDESPKEPNFQTERKVVTTLNRYMPTLKLEIDDIEIGHRLGKPKGDGTPRQIIVQFCSRGTKAEILSKKRLLKGSGIFINEDLTRTNQHVLSCIRKKLPDEVESAWSRDGNLFYKNKTGSIHRVHFNDYQTLIDLPWPSQAAPTNKGRTPTRPGGAWLSPVNKSGQTGS